jgi:hypothetical protein
VTYYSHFADVNWHWLATKLAEVVNTNWGYVEAGESPIDPEPYSLVMLTEIYKEDTATFDALARMFKGLASLRHDLKDVLIVLLNRKVHSDWQQVVYWTFLNQYKLNLDEEVELLNEILHK